MTTRKTDDRPIGSNTDVPRTGSSRRRVLSAAGALAAVALAGCAGDEGDDEEMPPEDDDSPPEDDEEPPEDDGITDPSDGLEVLVAHAYDGGPVFDDDRLHYADYATTIKGLGMAYSAQRWNELGDDNYGGVDVMTEDMPETARYVVELYNSVNGLFYDGNELAGYADPSNGGWERSGGPTLADYENTVFTYHTHHRGIGRIGRVAEHLIEEEGYEADDDTIVELRDLRDEISLGTIPEVFANVHWVLDERLEDGTFVDADGNVTTESMCLGMRSLNGLGYAWQRRNGVGGRGDHEQPGLNGMGNVSHDAMSFYLGGWDEAALSEAMEAIGETINDEYWNADAGAYDFGEGTTYHITEFGALMDGLQAIWEFLYIPDHADRDDTLVGDLDDPDEEFEGLPYPGKVQNQDVAMDVLDNAMTMLQAVFDADIDWVHGAPETIEFSGGEVEPASETVDVGATWKFLNQLWGGHCVFRERGEGHGGNHEDSPELIQAHYQAEIWDRQDEIRGPVLEGGILDRAHLNDDDYPVASIGYDDGAVEDDTVYTATVANMLMGIENVYRGSGDPEFRDWDDDESAANTEALFDVFQANIDLLQDELILREAP